MTPFTSSLKRRIEKQSDATTKAYEDLSEAIDKFNERMKDEFEKVQDALREYNEAVTDASSLRDDIVSEMDSFYEDKSERWKESEKGETYSTMKSEWEDADLEEISIDCPDDIDVDFENAGESLGNLPVDE